MRDRMTLIAGVAAGILFGFMVGRAVPLEGAASTVRAPPGSAPAATESDAAGIRRPPGTDPAVPLDAPRATASQCAFPPGAVATLRDALAPASPVARLAALYAWVGGLPAEALGSTMDEADAMANAADGEMLRDALYRRWLELDPHGAVDHMLTRPADDRRRYLYGFFYQWATLDRPAAVAVVAELPLEARQLAAQGILRSVMRTDPEALPALGERLGLSSGQILGRTQAARVREAVADVRRQARTDPAGALQVAAALGDEVRYVAVSETVREWAARDPQAAAQATLLLEDVRLREVASSEAINVWADSDPEGAATWAFALTDPPVRLAALGSALERLADRSPQQALLQALTLDGQEAAGVLGRVFSVWAPKDPRAAAEALAGLEPGRGAMAAVHNVAYQYVQLDPESALAWSLRLEGPAAQQARATTFSQYAESAPEAAARQVDAIADARVRHQTAVAMVGTWARRDADAALAWALTQPPDRRRAAVIGQVFVPVAGSDPARSLALREGLREPADRDAATNAILTAGAGYLSADVLIDLYEDIADPTLKQQAAGAVAARLHGDDPEAAQAFIAQAGIGDTNCVPMAVIP